MSSRRFAAAAALVFVAAVPGSAQVPLATPTSGLAFGVGLFGYGVDRFTNDRELRITAVGGWRGMISDFTYVEPHVRVMTAFAGWDGDPCNPDGCGGGHGVTQTVPAVWPGLGFGVTFGDDARAHSIGATVAVGVGDRPQPMLGLRYEMAVRRSAVYVELSADRNEWGDRRYDIAADVSYVVTEERWMGGLSAGVRFWLRDVGTPAPKPIRTPDFHAEDAGILPPEPVPAKADPDAEAPASD